MTRVNTPRTIASCLDEVLHGQDGNIRKIVSAGAAGLHVLLDACTGKTTLAKAPARLVEAGYLRVQFAPDLLSSEIAGVPTFDAPTHGVRFHEGPIFAHVPLAKENKRVSSRTPSALRDGANAGGKVRGRSKKSALARRRPGRRSAAPLAAACSTTRGWSRSGGRSARFVLSAMVRQNPTLAPDVVNPFRLRPRTAGATMTARSCNSDTGRVSGKWVPCPWPRS